jgi:hypothetical protein
MARLKKRLPRKTATELLGSPSSATIVFTVTP